MIKNNCRIKSILNAYIYNKIILIKKLINEYNKNKLINKNRTSKKNTTTSKKYIELIKI